MSNTDTGLSRLYRLEWVDADLATPTMPVQRREFAGLPSRLESLQSTLDYCRFMGFDVKRLVWNNHTSDWTEVSYFDTVMGKM